MAVMIDVGLFVEGVADTVTCQVADNAVAVFLAMLLNGMTDVAHKAEGLGGLHAYLQTLTGHAHQLFLLGCGLSDNEHTRGICIVAIDDGSEVDVDDVALLQDVLGLGDTVTDDLVDARTDGHGERRSVLVAAIIETGGNGVVLLAIAATYLVNLQRRHAGADVLGHLVEHSGVDDARTADALNLLRRLDEVAGRHQFAFRFPVHHLLVQLCRLLP